jgi:uncharacterized protein
MATKGSRHYRLLALVIPTAFVVGLFWYGYFLVQRERGREKWNGPLVEAVGKQDVAAVRSLLQRGANPNVRYTGERKPPPPRTSFVEVVKALFQRRQGRPDEGLPLLTIASGMGYDQIVMLLLDAGANPDAFGQDPEACIFNSDCTTALHYATLLGRTKMVETLLSHGANPDAPDRAGRTPLLIAVRMLANLEAAKRNAKDPLIITEAGALLWLKRDEGKEKESEAAFLARLHRDYSRIARALLASGANVNAKDQAGVSPLDYARKRQRRTALVTLLTLAGAKE